MGCPSKKKLALFVSDPESLSSGMKRHIESCPLCRGILDEEKFLNDFLIKHHKEVKPPEFLWTRIESHLDDEYRVSLGKTQPIFSFWTAVLTTVVLVAVSSMIIFNMQRQPSTRGMLASIDSEYRSTMFEVQKTRGNPFDGIDRLFKIKDKNPFKSEVGKSTFESDKNPFTSCIDQEYINKE